MLINLKTDLSNGNKRITNVYYSPFFPTEIQSSFFPTSVPDPMRIWQEIDVFPEEMLDS